MTNDLPQSLRPIGHFLKVGNEHASRDVVIYYWCLYRAVQEGMKLDKASPEALNVLTSTLSTLEQVKKDNPGVDGLTQDVVAQAHVEDQAQRLFNYANTQDKAGIYNVKVVKAYYTSSYLFDVLGVFGELDENIQSARKYCKWRATYIQNCLKTGETPVPYNASTANDDETNFDAPMSNLTAGIGSVDLSNNVPFQPGPNSMHEYFPDLPSNASSSNQYGFNPNENVNPVPPHRPSFFPNAGSQPFNQLQPTNQYPSQPQFNHPPIAAHLPQPQLPYSTANNFEVKQSDLQPSSDLKLEDFIEARKFTKYALNALDYDDAKTAIENIHKALAILQKH